MKRKAIIFLPDGMADDPLKELNGKTPLEAAHTPGMDEIARTGQNGTFLTLPSQAHDGSPLPTSSDVANMSVLGFKPENNYPGRGPIEAASQGIPMAPDDVVFRCNLVYASDDEVLRDYSAGHIDNAVSAQLMADLQKEFGNADLTFYPGVSYRNLLVLHGKKFSDRIDYFKPDSSQDLPLSELKSSAIDDTPEAQFTVKFLHELEAKAHQFLAAHPLNQGKSAPANYIWPWSPGHKPQLKTFSELYSGCKGAIISAVDVIKGIGRCTGMTVVEVPNVTGFIDTNYAGKAQAAIEAIKTHDLVYVHVEATDECSHMGDLKLKLQAIEKFDSGIVVPVREALKGQPVNFAVLPDHPVPILLRKHTRTPVPLAVCGPDFAPDTVSSYSETLAPTGNLGFLNTDQLVKLLLGL